MFNNKFSGFLVIAVLVSVSLFTVSWFLGADSAISGQATEFEINKEVHPVYWSGVNPIDLGKYCYYDSDGDSAFGDPPQPSMYLDGTVYGKKTNYNDYCLDEDTVVEYYCISNSVHYAEIDCEPLFSDHNMVYCEESSYSGASYCGSEFDPTSGGTTTLIGGFSN
jgi:hypothetical protein